MKKTSHLVTSVNKQNITTDSEMSFVGSQYPNVIGI